MKILFLAPQPFFQERGTPIAVRLALQVLASRGKDAIDLLTYREGTEVKIPGVDIYRIKSPSFLNGVGPGISVKKLLCDVIFLLTALSMVWKRRRDQYELIHAVEESVFIACFIKLLFGIPYIYDMDSSLALQLTEKWIVFRPFLFLFQWLESLAVRYSSAVVPVCDALAAIAKRHGSKQVQILYDISLLDLNGSPDNEESIRQQAGISDQSIVLLYIGNLERYQGIDLMLESFQFAASNERSSHLVVIGGSPAHISMYRSRAEQLEVGDRVHFLGTRPVAQLSRYLSQADILVSPRTKGNNTPMKIYSYLHSGKAVLATNLPTHTQAMDESVSKLAPATPKDFGEAMLELIRDIDLRTRLGSSASRLAEEKYTFEIFSRNLSDLYQILEDRQSGIAVSPSR